MPYFIFRGRDDPERSSEVRAKLRPLHRLYIREMRDGVRVVAGGMVVSDEGDRATGTLLVFDSPDRQGVMRFLEGDPYWDARLYLSIEIDRWDWGLGPPRASE